jgi:uncharacterized protein YqgC (DUF456 family)
LWYVFNKTDNHNCKTFVNTNFLIAFILGYFPAFTFRCRQFNYQESPMPQWLETFAHVMITLTMLVGLFGLVIPIFPGNVVIWVAALIYGLIFGFGVPGVIIFLLLTVLTIIAMLADNVLMGAKARGKGAAWSSIILALVAGVVFTLVLPPFGGIIAAPLVLFGKEYYRLQDRDKAIEVMRALLAGWGWSFLARFGIGLVMIFLWGIWVFLG